jgi:hypothetical protein
MVSSSSESAMVVVHGLRLRLRRPSLGASEGNARGGREFCDSTQIVSSVSYRVMCHCIDRQATSSASVDGGAVQLAVSLGGRRYGGGPAALRDGFRARIAQRESAPSISMFRCRRRAGGALPATRRYLPRDPAPFQRPVRAGGDA